MEPKNIALTTDVSNFIINELTKFLKQELKSNSIQKIWLSEKEAMEQLGVCKSTIQRYRFSGKLPFSQIGGKIYIKLDDLNSFLEAHYSLNFKTNKHEKY